MPPPSPPITPTHAEFQTEPSIPIEMLHRAADGTLEIDLRELPPPLPMITVLRLAEALRDDATVTITLDRDPIFVHPELADIGWALTLTHRQAEVWRFRLEKAR